jgi:BASS family bile acid:Na+ symporter
VTHAVLLPLLAFAVAFALRLTGAAAAGLVLIASCPASAMANLFTHLARGDVMLAVCLSAAASLTSVVTVPVFVNAAFRLFPSAHAPVQLSVLSAAIGLLLVSMLPVAAGMALRWRRPAAARTVQARMGLPALLVVVGIILATIWSVKADLMPALVGAGAPALVLNVSGVAVAWGAAAWLGLDAPQRIAVGLECGLQNFAMAAFVALTLLSDTPLLLPGIAYGLTMYLSAGAVVLLARRRVQP